MRNIHEEITTIKVNDGLKIEKDDIPRFVEEKAASELIETKEFKDFFKELYGEETDISMTIEGYDGVDIFYKTDTKKEFSVKTIANIVERLAKKYCGDCEYEDCVNDIEREAKVSAYEIMSLTSDFDKQNKYKELRKIYKDKLSEYNKLFEDFYDYAKKNLSGKLILRNYDNYDCFTTTVIHGDLISPIDFIGDRRHKTPKEAFNEIVLSKEKINEINEANEGFKDKLEETKQTMKEKYKEIKLFYKNNE